MGVGGAKAPLPPPTSFYPATSTNVGISPQNFMTFSFNLFATLVQNFPQKKSQIIEPEPRTPFTKSGFSGQILIKLRYATVTKFW